MTKKKYFYLFSSLFILGFMIWKLRPHSSQNTTVQDAKHVDSTKLSESPMDKPKIQVKVFATGEKYENTPSQDWKAKVESHLKVLAGNDLKEIQIQTERTLVISRDNHNLLVESVVIKLTNTQNSRSSFRAMVDPQTGKILETWDRTVFDPAHVREGFRYKLDPRYTN